MDLQKNYQNSKGNISLFLSEEGECIMLKLSGNVVHEDFKEGCEKLYNLITVYKYRKLIFELKELTRTDMQSRAWYATVFLPRLIKNYGINFKSAVVESQNKFEQMSIGFLVKVSQNLGYNDIQSFDNQQDAISWITKKPEIPSISK
jgi:hypothetical protein